MSELVIREVGNLVERTTEVRIREFGQRSVINRRQDAFSKVILPEGQASPNRNKHYQDNRQTIINMDARNKREIAPSFIPSHRPWLFVVTDSVSLARLSFTLLLSAAIDSSSFS